MKEKLLIQGNQYLAYKGYPYVKTASYKKTIPATGLLKLYSIDKLNSIKLVNLSGRFEIFGGGRII